MARLVPNALTKTVAIAALVMVRRWWRRRRDGAWRDQERDVVGRLRRSNRQGRSVAFSRGIKAPRERPVVRRIDAHVTAARL